MPGFDSHAGREGASRSPLRVWLAQFGEPSPRDASARLMRTGALAKALLARGHRVVWWSSAFDHFTKAWLDEARPIRSDLFDVEFQFLKGIGYSRNVSVRRLLDHRIISRRIRPRLARAARPDVIVASSPPYDIAGELARFATRNAIPLIVDVRDPWPDIFADALPRPLRLLSPLLLLHERRIFRACLQRATAVTAVTGPLLDLALTYAGRGRGERDEVIHTWLEAMPPPAGVARSLPSAEWLQGRFVVVFIGSFGDVHDPRQLVEAARALDPKRFAFVLAGDGHLRPALEEAARDLPHVRFTGWLDENGIRALLELADVGVCSTPFANDVLPNKAIIYLSAGLPILSAFGGELHALIARYGCGENYAPRATDALAAAIRRLADDRTRYDGARLGARRLFAEQFDARTQQDRFVAKIERLAGRRDAGDDTRSTERGSPSAPVDA